MREHAHLNETGFTLIEFMIAIFIMMVGLLGLLQTVNYAYSNNLITIFRNEAAMIGDDQMISEKAKAFDNMSTFGAGSPNIQTITRDLRNASKAYTVTKIGDTVGNSKQVTITVSWQHKNIPYTHTVSSVVTK